MRKVNKTMEHLLVLDHRKGNIKYCISRNKDTCSAVATAACPSIRFKACAEIKL